MDFLTGMLKIEWYTCLSRTWKKGLMHQEYTFVNFFVPWCPWSRRLAPIWDEAAKRIDKMSWRDLGKFLY
jgi:thiol-disulfide isomerase/thioredoxin